MSKLLPFPADRVQRTAAYVLQLTASSASRANLDTPEPWANRPVPPEALGNMLQALVHLEPAVVLVIESIVADILAQLRQL